MLKPSWESDFVGYFTSRRERFRRLAYALCGNWHTADDLIQTTFVKLYRRWPRIRSETADAYAQRTLVNTFLSARRASARQEIVMAEVPESATTDTDRGGAIDIGRALAALPPRQRAVLVLRFLEDLPVAAVAEVLGIAEGTVTSQTARGLHAMRGAIEALTGTRE